MSAGARTSHCGSEGFTLIEMMMAMFVMTVGLLGLLQSVQVAYEHNTRNRLREEATQVAEEQMSYLKNLPTEGFNPFTTAGRFSVTRRNQGIGGDARRLRVIVAWRFKNVSTSHQIYTIKKM